MSWSLPLCLLSAAAFYVVTVVFYVVILNEVKDPCILLLPFADDPYRQTPTSSGAPFMQSHRMSLHSRYGRTVFRPAAKINLKSLQKIHHRFKCISKSIFATQFTTT